MHIYLLPHWEKMLRCQWWSFPYEEFFISFLNRIQRSQDGPWKVSHGFSLTDSWAKQKPHINNPRSSKATPQGSPRGEAGYLERVPPWGDKSSRSNVIGYKNSSFTVSQQNTLFPNFTGMVSPVAVEQLKYSYKDLCFQDVRPKVLQFDTMVAHS